MNMVQDEYYIVEEYHPTIKGQGVGVKEVTGLEQVREKSQDLRLKVIEQELSFAENRCNSLRDQLDQARHRYQKTNQQPPTPDNGVIGKPPSSSTQSRTPRHRRHAQNMERQISSHSTKKYRLQKKKARSNCDTSTLKNDEIPTRDQDQSDLYPVKDSGPSKTSSRVRSGMSVSMKARKSGDIISSMNAPCAELVVQEMLSGITKSVNRISDLNTTITETEYWEGKKCHPIGKRRSKRKDIAEKPYQYDTDTTTTAEPQGTESDKAVTSKHRIRSTHPVMTGEESEEAEGKETLGNVQGDEDEEQSKRSLKTKRDKKVKDLASMLQTTTLFSDLSKMLQPATDLTIPIRSKQHISTTSARLRKKQGSTRLKATGSRNALDSRVQQKIKTQSPQMLSEHDGSRKYNSNLIELYHNTAAVASTSEDNILHLDGDMPKKGQKVLWEPAKVTSQRTGHIDAKQKAEASFPTTKSGNRLQVTKAQQPPVYLKTRQRTRYEPNETILQQAHQSCKKLQEMTHDLNIAASEVTGIGGNMTSTGTNTLNATEEKFPWRKIANVNIRPAPRVANIANKKRATSAYHYRYPDERVTRPIQVTAKRISARPYTAAPPRISTPSPRLPDDNSDEDALENIEQLGDGHAVQKNYELPTISSSLKQAANTISQFNFHQIPFVGAKSTTTSHNLGLNIQQVLSVIKNRQPKVSGISPTLALNMGILNSGQGGICTEVYPQVNTKNNDKRSECHLLNKDCQCIAKDSEATLEGADHTKLHKRTPHFKPVRRCKTARDKSHDAEISTDRNSNKNTPRHSCPGEAWDINKTGAPFERCTCLPHKTVTYGEVLKQCLNSGDQLPSFLVPTGGNSLYSHRINKVNTTPQTESSGVLVGMYNPDSDTARQIEEGIREMANEFFELTAKYENLEADIQNGLVDQEQVSEELEFLKDSLAEKEKKVNLVLSLQNRVMSLKDTRAALSESKMAAPPQAQGTATVRLTRTLRNVQHFLDYLRTN